MVADETRYFTYEVIYRLKNGKKMRRAYVGASKAAFEETVRELEKNEHLRYLSKSVTRTIVTIFD